MISELYANAWGSTLGHGSQTEIDLTAGYEAEVSKVFGVDLFATYYAYPSDGSANYVEATAVIKTTRGPASASLGVSYAPPQRGTRDESGRGHGNGYVFRTVDYEVTKSPVTLKAGLATSAAGSTRSSAAGNGTGRSEARSSSSLRNWAWRMSAATPTAATATRWSPRCSSNGEPGRPPMRGHKITAGLILSFRSGVGGNHEALASCH